MAEAQHLRHIVARIPEEPLQIDRDHMGDTRVPDSPVERQIGSAAGADDDRAIRRHTRKRQIQRRGEFRVLAFMIVNNRRPVRRGTTVADIGKIETQGGCAGSREAAGNLDRAARPARMRVATGIEQDHRARA